SGNPTGKVYGLQSDDCDIIVETDRIQAIQWQQRIPLNCRYCRDWNEEFALVHMPAQLRQMTAHCIAAIKVQWVNQAIVGWLPLTNLRVFPKSVRTECDLFLQRGEVLLI